MISQEDLFNRYSLERSTYEKATSNWSKLSEIFDHYVGLNIQLGHHETLVASLLQEVPVVHSVKSRLKDPEHLIAKLITKSDLDAINENNYRKEVTDLIGLRALHLFKDDWIQIHRFIKDTWRLKQKPTANVRIGDSEAALQKFKSEGCKIRFHPAGYRSVHYLITSRINKETAIAEIQVRTIFEEGWSEIDHTIRYPYNLYNDAINQYLVIFNRLAGSADEMGTFIRYLQTHFENREAERHLLLSEVNQLKMRIDQMSIKTEEKNIIKSGIEDLNKLASSPTLLGQALQTFSQGSLISRDVDLLKQAFPQKRPKKQKT